MWMTPFYLFFGLFFIYLFKNTINLKKLKYFFVIFIFFFILSPMIYSVISISQDDKRTDYQGRLIAKKVQNEWDKDHKDPIEIVLGNEWNAGNLSYHLKSRPAWKGFITEDKLSSLSQFICIDEVCVGTK
jgi:hypothetical protein